jgi:hypothetical protein
MLHLLVTTRFPPTSLFVEFLFDVSVWIFLEEIERKGKDYEQNKIFKDIWSAKLQCWVYGEWTKEGTKIEGKEKLLASP